VPQTLTSQKRVPKLSISLNKIVFFICLLVALYFCYERYSFHVVEQTTTEAHILKPHVNDIYFLDVRVINEKVADNNKYKLAKVIRITDDNIVFVYGNFFYQWQYAAVNAIKYGDLSNNNYFASIPDFISFSDIKK
jgi:hypothetical protein